MHEQLDEQKKKDGRKNSSTKDRHETDKMEERNRLEKHKLKYRLLP